MSVFILSLNTRRPDISEDEFFQHWNKVHAPKIAALCQKHQITGYTQIHTPKATRESVSGGLSIPLSTMEADGVTIWQVSSLEAFRDALRDPYCREVIGPDEANFLDQSKQFTVTMGPGHQIVAKGQSLVDCVEELAELARVNEKAAVQGH